MSRSTIDAEAKRLFVQPGWWLALAVLLVNDHICKALALSGHLPGAVTGKLSDIAGLAFAPALAWTIGALISRNRACAWIAFALIPTLFTTLNISTACCLMWTKFFAWFGLKQVIWSDPFDLLALPAVVLSYRWVRLSEHPSVNTGRNSRRVVSPLLRFAGLGLGGFACLATSTPWSATTIATPAVRNATGETLSIAIQDALAPIDCEWGASQIMQHLRMGDFDTARVAVLEDGEYAVLGKARTSGGYGDGGGAAGEGGAADGEGTRCGAAIIVAAGLPPTVIRWDLRDVSDLLDLDAAEEVVPGSVYVEQFGVELHLAVGDGMSVAKLEGSQ